MEWKLSSFLGENELIQQLNMSHKIGSKSKNKKLLRFKMQMAWTYFYVQFMQCVDCKTRKRSHAIHISHIVDFTKRGPVVQFSGTFIRRECVPVNFSAFDKSAGSSIACRTQIPLKAAYAFTIHKCQGMTVDSATIDCHVINRPGQLGVAISRVKSKDGVFLPNFHPS